MKLNIINTTHVMTILGSLCSVIGCGDDDSNPSTGSSSLKPDPAASDNGDDGDGLSDGGSGEGLGPNPRAMSDAGVTIPADAGLGQNSDPDDTPNLGIDAGPGETVSIEKETETLVADAADLRGLTYAKNGKIYASGYSDTDPAERRTLVVRFNPDGTLDDSFADAGVLLYNLVPGDEQSLALVELDNDDILVQVNVSDGQGGEPIADVAQGAPVPRPNGQNVALLRLDSTGSPVTSFGTAGVMLVDFGWTNADDVAFPIPSYDSSKPERELWSGSGFPKDTAWDIQIDHSATEEKVVIFGYGPAARAAEGVEQRTDNDRFVVRVLASDGSLDPTFNRNGDPYTFNSPGDFRDNARRGIVEADGAIVSGGYANFGEGFGNHVVLIRLNPDGTPDEGFGFGIPEVGVARFNPFVDDGGAAECYAVALQSTGRYVTTGYGYATGTDRTSRYGYATSQAQDLVSFGITKTGLDLSFGVAGTRAIQSEEASLGDTQDRGRHLTVLADDRVVQAGRFGPNPAIFILTKDGALDESVGEGGRFAYPTFAGTQFFNVAVSPDGSQIAATTTSHADGARLALLRLSGD